MQSTTSYNVQISFFSVNAIAASYLSLNFNPSFQANSQQSLLIFCCDKVKNHNILCKNLVKCRTCIDSCVKLVETIYTKLLSL